MFTGWFPSFGRPMFLTRASSLTRLGHLTRCEQAIDVGYCIVGVLLSPSILGERVESGRCTYNEIPRSRYAPHFGKLSRAVGVQVEWGNGMLIGGQTSSTGDGIEFIVSVL